VALLHFALGVHQDDLLEDYLLTNTAGDGEARVEAVRRDLNQRFAAQLSEEAVRVVTSVEAEYLDCAFNAISERFGSVDDYLSRGLQLTAAVREAIANNFVK
jgi:protein tyrosine/serine phosphatase